jgi:hypothetical protein
VRRDNVQPELGLSVCERLRWSDHGEEGETRITTESFTESTLHDDKDSAHRNHGDRLCFDVHVNVWPRRLGWVLNDESGHTARNVACVRIEESRVIRRRDCEFPTAKAIHQQVCDNVVPF